MENQVQKRVLWYDKWNNIESVIRISTLKWIGHNGRMKNYVKSKILTKQKKNEGTRLKGRLQSRWTICVERDLLTFGIQNWTRQAEDREGWRKINRSLMK